MGLNEARAYIAQYDAAQARARALSQLSETEITLAERRELNAILMTCHTMRQQMPNVLRRVVEAWETERGEVEAWEMRHEELVTEIARLNGLLDRIYDGLDDQWVTLPENEDTMATLRTLLGKDYE